MQHERMKAIKRRVRDDVGGGYPRESAERQL
jgi:hypothetical protein